LGVTDETRNFTHGRIVQAKVGRQLKNELYGKVNRRVARPADRKVLALESHRHVRLGRPPHGSDEDCRRVLKRGLFHGGRIKLNGETVRFDVPRSAINNRIAYITGDRELDDLFDTMGIAQNIFYGKLVKRGEVVSTLHLGQ
jgi:simple sugar transport system ATP-binding protein/ribose transport system ATP-binding protein